MSAFMRWPAIKRLRQHGDSIASLLIRALSVLAGFGITFFLGHQMGPAANGQYALITQTAMFLSIMAVGGLDMALVKEFSVATARKLPIHIGSFLKTSAYSLGFTALILLALLAGGNELLALLLKGALPAGALALLCLILIARTLTRLMSAILRSQKAYLLAQTVEVLIIPLVVLACIMLGLFRTVEEILWITAISGLAAAAIGVFASLRYTSGVEEAHSVSMRSVLKTAVPLWGVAIALNLADWYNLATTAAMLGVYKAGIFRVAMQMCTMLSIVSMGLLGVFSAKISEAVARNDKQMVAQLSRTATRLSTALVLPAALLLFVFADPILHLVGPEFTEAATLMRIMVVGQAIYTITGPAGLTLALTGHQRVNLLITLINTGSLLVLAPVFLHYFGLAGIASYTAFLLVARNIASLYAVYKLEGINVVTGKVVAAPRS
jgi:O-antigen/teichoic acid export membrane protein